MNISNKTIGELCQFDFLDNVVSRSIRKNGCCSPRDWKFIELHSPQFNMELQNEPLGRNQKLFVLRWISSIVLSFQLSPLLLRGAKKKQMVDQVGGPLMCIHPYVSVRTKEKKRHFAVCVYIHIICMCIYIYIFYIHFLSYSICFVSYKLDFFSSKHGIKNKSFLTSTYQSLLSSF